MCNYQMWIVNACEYGSNNVKSHYIVQVFVHYFRQENSNRNNVIWQYIYKLWSYWESQAKAKYGTIQCLQNFDEKWKNQKYRDNENALRTRMHYIYTYLFCFCFVLSSVFSRRFLLTSFDSRYNVSVCMYVCVCVHVFAKRIKMTLRKKNCI